MSFLKGEEVCIFSGFSGQLTLNGEPAAGARIVRHVSWKDEKGESDETIADGNGEFSFPSKWDRMSGLMSVLPAEFVAHQKVSVFYSNSEYLIWNAGKGDKGEYGEFNHKSVYLTCELTDDLQPIEIDRGLAMTSCRIASIK